MRNGYIPLPFPPSQKSRGIHRKPPSWHHLLVASLWCHDIGVTLTSPFQKSRDRTLNSFFVGKFYIPWDINSPRFSHCSPSKTVRVTSTRGDVMLTSPNPDGLLQEHHMSSIFGPHQKANFKCYVSHHCGATLPLIYIYQLCGLSPTRVLSPCNMAHSCYNLFATLFFSTGSRPNFLYVQIGNPQGPKALDSLPSYICNA